MFGTGNSGWKGILAILAVIVYILPYSIFKGTKKMVLRAINSMR